MGSDARALLIRLAAVMTAEERNQIEGLRNDLAMSTLDIVKQIGAIQGQLQTLHETTQLQLTHLQHQCDERHGMSAKRINGVEEREEQNTGWRQRLTGMAVPVALFVAIASILINLFT